MRDQDLYQNMLGQDVDITHPDNASGYYLASNDAVDAMNEAGTNLCPDGMRPGRMVIKGLPASFDTPAGYIPTCGGKISQEDMPDIHIIDWSYRIYIDMALALLVLILIGAIGLKVIR
jgi:hypothetical protein